MRQTLLLARKALRLPHPFVPRWQSESSAAAFHLTATLWVRPTCPSLLVCLSSELRCWAKPCSRLPSAWLLSSDTRIVKMFLQCKPQQNDWDPGALARFCIVSETRGGKVWRSVYCKRDSLPGSLEGFGENRMLGQRAWFVCGRNMRARAHTTTSSVQPSCKGLHWLSSWPVLHLFYSYICTNIKCIYFFCDFGSCLYVQLSSQVMLSDQYWIVSAFTKTALASLRNV